MICFQLSSLYRIITYYSCVIIFTEVCTYNIKGAFDFDVPPAPAIISFLDTQRAFFSGWGILSPSEKFFEGPVPPNTSVVASLAPGSSLSGTSLSMRTHVRVRRQLLIKQQVEAPQNVRRWDLVPFDIRNSVRWQDDVNDIVDQFVLHDSVTRGSRTERRRGVDFDEPRL